MESSKLHLILLAGGRGLRAGGDASVPKQFRATGRGLLFAVSLQNFLAGERWCPATVTVTVPDDWRGAVESALVDLPVAVALAPAGETRTASTWHAAEVLRNGKFPANHDLVAVHDAARPFATAKLLAELCHAAETSGGAVPGVPVPDTIVSTEGAGARYLDRDVLRAVQTPQVFRWDIFHAAHARAAAESLDLTDDGGLLALCGHEPTVVPGHPDNWKVTTDADWQQAQRLLEP